MTAVHGRSAIRHKRLQRQVQGSERNDFRRSRELRREVAFISTDELVAVLLDLAAVRLLVSMSDAKATIAARTWSPSSWRSLESLQMASYEAADAPEKIFDKLSKLPPLVQSTEVDALKELLAAAARGERFIVQGGDCAERFMDCEMDRLWRQLGVLFQMGEIVSKSTSQWEQIELIR